MKKTSQSTVLATLAAVTAVAVACLTNLASTDSLVPGSAPSSKQAIEPIAPILPSSLVEQLQDGRYADADTRLQAMSSKAKTAGDKAYLGLIIGITRRLEAKQPEARQALQDALKVDPNGAWSGKLRFELATLELASSHPVEAEALARAEVESLLSDRRKDRLAAIIHDFARSLLAPPDALTPADPNSAHDLLAQARDLAKGTDLAARLLFEMGKASRQANNQPRAIEELTAYIKQYPKGSDRDQARFELAEAQLATGQNVVARMTWSDLARDLKAKTEGVARDLRARSLYQISRTYGLPNPPDDAQMNLGLAALQRFLENSPDHPLAVRAAYELGSSALARGKSDQALASFRAFLAGEGFKAAGDDAKKELLELSMSAAFQIGQILQGQEKFDEAISAWKGYLAQYPNGPQSADAQRSIVDTEFLIAQTHFNRKQYDQARAAWKTFVAKNPLDGRVPQALFEIAQSYFNEKKYDDAVQGWDLLAGKFPNSEPAAHAQFAVASTYENERGDLAGAIERYRKVLVEPWQAQAKQRIAVMEAKALSVITPRTYRSGETPTLEISTRNLEKLIFSAYKLDAEAYFRKKLFLRQVEALDIGLVAPDAEWTEEVPGQAKYKPIDHKYPLPKLAGSGVWVVKVSDEKTLQATTLVVASDIDAIIKSSLDQLLVFVEDMKTGKGKANARVLVSNQQEVLLEAKTGSDGVLLHNWDKPRVAGQDFYRVMVIDGDQVAGTGLAIPGKIAEGLAARAFVLTDRPAYRPGQEVEIKGVIRTVAKGQYANPARQVFRATVVDSKGRLLLNREVRLSDFGTFHVHISLDPSAPLGTYTVGITRPGFNDAGGTFEVQAYQLEKIDLKFDIPKTVVFRGDKVEADVIAKYQYGTPLAGREIEVSLPDGRTIKGTTDASGKYHVSLETNGFAEEQALVFSARLPRDNVAAAAMVMLAVRGFAINLDTKREVYLDGETFTLNAQTRDAAGKPTGRKLSVAVIKRVSEPGRTTERQVAKSDVATDEKTGKAAIPIKVEDADGGSYVIRVFGADQFGNPIVAEHNLSISGKNDPARIRILTDRTTFRSGETAKVDLHVRDQGGTALLTWEGDKILSYKIVNITEGDNAIEWLVDAAQFPNFTLSAARMALSRLDSATLDIRVERELKVTLEPSKPEVLPGEEVEVEVKVTDQLGHPVAAELAVVLVDRALLRLFEAQNGSRQGIAEVFYNQTRTGSFATESTNAFRYQALTTRVPEAIVDEADRIAALASDKLAEARQQDLPMLGEGIKSQLKGDAAAQAPAATPNMAAGGGMGGAMMSPSEARLASASASAAFAGRSGTALRQMSPMERKKAKRSMDGTDVAGKAEADDKEAGLEKSRDAKLGWAAEMGDQGKLEQAPSRQRFVETAYWNPSVVTGADGKAKIHFKAPSALSNYRFDAWGVTAQDTLVGQSTAELAVRKPFLVDLKVPSIFTQGDKPRVMAEVHHSGIVGTLEIALKIYTGQRDEVFPKTIEIKNDGIEQIQFEPFEVPDNDLVRFSLTGKCGTATDSLVIEVPIRPWGVEAIASASGTSSDDTTVIVGLPGTRTYESPEMVIELSPNVHRMLIEMALGNERNPIIFRNAQRCAPIPPITTADRAADLLASASVLGYLRAIGGTEAPESSRLRDRVQSLAAELVSAQNDDGGWSWIGGSKGVSQPQNLRPSDSVTSARVVWALDSAARLRLVSDPNSIERGLNYVSQALGKIDQGNHDATAALLHALSLRGKATFEQANALNRLRDALSSSALANLALIFANLDRAGMGTEVLTILARKARTEAAGPGTKPRVFWDLGDGRESVETTALATLAFARVRPAAAELAGAVEWLLAHRFGDGWQPHRAKGPALAALAKFQASAKTANDRYKLVVKVNGHEVHSGEVIGSTEGKTIQVPRKFVTPGAPNRVEFDIEGRGTLGYSVSLTGFTRDFKPDQNPANRSFVIQKRVYLAADPELAGKPLASGFGVAVNAQWFENKISQVALGGRARVLIQAARTVSSLIPVWQRDFLVLEEHLPAGATLIEGSVQSQASLVTTGDGVITFYFAPNQEPGRISYDIFGYLPGDYRALPPRLASAYDPGKLHLGPTGELKVLEPGKKSNDPYKATPDELFARGKELYEAGRYAEAAPALEELFGEYTLRDDIAKEAARMLLLINVAEYQPRKIVQYFEVLKVKFPDLVLTFDVIRAVGKAYRDINEPERAFLVWRAIAESSYLEDAKVGETLRQRGKTLEGLAYLLELWREYPNTASIESDLLGLTQVLSNLATRAATDPAARRELLAAKLSRIDLIHQSIRLLEVFLSQSPKNPLADEASLALVAAYLDLEDDKTVVALSERFAKLYPKSTFQDSFVYSEALGRFHLGEYDRAVELAEKISKAVYKDDNGNDVPSPNKWESVYILGQIFDARRQPAKALPYYQRVVERFSDAATAVRAWKRVSFHLDEVTVTRPAKAGDEAQNAVVAPTSAKLDYRNVAEADVKVYPVDLMRLYLTRRNLNNIAGIDLAGIHPLLETKVKLGDGADYEDKTKMIPLPIKKEGAYLLMARGGNLHTSGIVLVSPLEIEAVEEHESGMVRVTVRDALTKNFVPKVQVKVIGSQNGNFTSGLTDLRGVFLAEGIAGQVTAIARKGDNQYAFYRGKALIGPQANKAAQPQQQGRRAGQNQTLEGNLRQLNEGNSTRQIDRLQKRYEKPGSGVEVQQAK